MFNIGSFQFSSPVLLAPMAGISDKPFRTLAKNFGAALTTSEMVVLQDNLLRTTKSQTRLDFTNEIAPISIQIAGSTPEQLVEYARKAYRLGADIIDINMGCPAKKVCNNASGSALLQDELLVANILQAVTQSVDIPITLKIRTGWDTRHNNCTTIANIAEDVGVSMLAIHGRTRADKYSGNAEYDSIAAVVQNVNIPVIANGDIDSPEKAKQVLDYTGCDGVMIGRATQGKPWIIKQIYDYITTETYQEFTDKKQIILQHIASIYTFYPDKVADNIAKKHIKWYLFANNLGAFWKEIYPLHFSQRYETLQTILDNNPL
jgi:tRNA-dihydrouridine synthase B